jgi:hypothetical protein
MEGGDVELLFHGYRVFLGLMKKFWRWKVG